MNAGFQYPKPIGKLLLIFYSVAIIFGFYNLFVNLIYHTPLREAVLIGFFWSDLIVILVALALFILSIIVIVKVIKKKIPKIHLIYPIYFLSCSILSVLVPLILYKLYTYNQVLSILDNLIRYHFIFYSFDIVLPSFVIQNQFPDFPKGVLNSIRDILYI